MTCKECIHCDVCRYNDNVNEWCKYHEICHKRKDKSKIIELPCKAGDTVYFIKSAFSISEKPIKSLVDSIKILNNGNIIFRTDIGRVFDESKIGDIVLITKEEAEKALEVLKNE